MTAVEAQVEAGAAGRLLAGRVVELLRVSDWAFLAVTEQPGFLSESKRSVATRNAKNG